jgi:hypothetical protein
MTVLQPFAQLVIVKMVSKVVFTLQLHPDPDPDRLTGFYPDRNMQQPNGMLQKSPRCACDKHKFLYASRSCKYRDE